MHLLPRFAAVVALAAFVAAPAQAQNWVEHKPAGIGYRIEMPAAPQIQARDVPTAIGPIKTTMAVVDRGSIAYIVSHNDYPAAAIQGKSPDDLLDGIRNGQVGTHQLRSEQKIDMGGRPARHLVIETAQGQVILSRIVMVEARLFQAIYVGPRGTDAGEAAQRFINSFALVDR